MAGLDVVGLGLSTLDILMRLRDMPSWERPGSLSDFALEGGGPVGTACVAAARLGARVGFVGTAGNDLVAELKLRSLQREGIDLSRLVVRQQPETQLIMVYVQQETGERAFGTVKRAVPNAPLQVEELDKDYITSAAYLHLDGTHAEAALQAARWMHEAGKQVCLDGSRTDGRPLSPHMAALVAEADILICGSGFGRSVTGQSDLWAAGEGILALGPRTVVQTEGADGSYTVTATEHFHIPAFDVSVMDTTGAGDVFHGAFLVGLLRGWSLRSVALFATAVSALKCTKLGGRSGIPTFEEVLAFLRQRGIDNL